MHIKVGCDVSKRKFDAALLEPGGKYRSKCFDNDAQGFKAFMAWLHLHAPGGLPDVHVCMESTGAYHEALALHVHDSGVKVSVVNPVRVKRFMESEGVRNKTDSGDAKALARFCLKNEPEAWEAPSHSVRELQALVLRLQALQEMRQAEASRLDIAHESVRASIVQLIAALDTSIEDVRRQIQSTIDDDPDLRQRRDLLQSIPGLGNKTIPQLLAYIGRPERFKTVKALIAYASLAPLIRQSGSSVNKTRGTHAQGHRELKQALFYPALVAGKYNPLVAQFRDRLKAQNKPGLVIVVACMHKLLAIAYGVLKSKKPFDPRHLALKAA